MPRRLSARETEVLQASADGNTWQLRATGRYVIKVRGLHDRTVNHAAQILAADGLVRTVPANWPEAGRVWDQVVPTDMGLLALARAVQLAAADPLSVPEALAEAAAFPDEVGHV